jgi:hypothetical protein
MATKIQLRRDTAANFTSGNPTLAQGEPAYETDTGFMKIGDGTTAWTSLPYLSKFDSISVDTVNEKTSGNGVEVDGVEFKDGNVGIGITPSYLLHISRDDNGFLCSLDGVSSSKMQFYLETNNSILNIFDSGGNIGQIKKTLDGNFSLRNANSGGMHLNISTSGTTSTRDLFPISDDIYDIGSSSYRFDNIYATNGTIQTSDERDKDRILDIPDSLSIIDSLRPVSFKWKDYTQTIEKTKIVPVEKTRIVKKDGEEVEEKYTEEVEEKYTEEVERTFKRTHYGMIAQEVERSIIDLGISPDDFAPLIYDKESDKYGLRYGEFIPILIGSVKELKQQVEDLKAEIEKLKS